MRLSVIIPAYNEEKRIGQTLRDIEAYLARQEYDSEIIVVDDGSRDGTAALVRTAFPRVRLISYQPNHGKGHAVRTGIVAASGDYRLFCDADGSAAIDELDRMWPKFFESRADVVAGSRSLPKSDVQVRQHPIREQMGRIFNVFVRLLVLPGFVDTQCGFKVFTASSADLVFSRQRLDGFSFDTELLYIAKKHGLRIAQVPVRWRNSPHSRVNMVTDSSRMLLDLLKIRFCDLTGKYR